MYARSFSYTTTPDTRQRHHRRRHSGFHSVTRNPHPHNHNQRPLVRPNRRSHLDRIESLENQLAEEDSPTTTRIAASAPTTTTTPKTTTTSSTTTTSTTTTTTVARVQVPVVVQQPLRDATIILARQALLEDVQNEYSWDIEAGLVIRSEPAAGTLVERGSEVRLIVSAGRDPDSFDLEGMVGAMNFFVHLWLMDEPLVFDGRVYNQSDWIDVLSVSGRENEVDAEFCHNGNVDRYVEFVFQQVFVEELGLSSTLAQRMLGEPLLNPRTAEKFFFETQGGFYIERVTVQDGIMRDTGCPPNTWSTRIWINYEG